MEVVAPMAVFTVSADAPSVERSKPELAEGKGLDWARLIIQTHHLSQTVRRWGGFGRLVCPFHFTVERWAAPHGCTSRVRALKEFLRLASPVQIEAAVLAGDITRDEARHGVCEPQAGRHVQRSRLRKANRPGRGPAQPIPYPLERVDIS
jgi:hypothetical protein